MMTSLFLFSFFFFLNGVRVDEKCCEQSTHIHEAATQSHSLKKKKCIYIYIYIYEREKKKETTSKPEKDEVKK